MPDDSPAPLPPPPVEHNKRYNLVVIDTASKNSVALVSYIYSDKGRVNDIFTEYLNQKISEI